LWAGGESGLEQLRDFFDRHQIGLILIGTPGLEKRLARYPPALQPHRLRAPLPAAQHQRAALRPRPPLAPPRPDPRPRGLHRRRGDQRHSPAGNFRLVHRLLAQTERILEINHLHTITAEVVDAARETLVIGAE
jgi:hypothetical protein